MFRIYKLLPLLLIGLSTVVNGQSLKLKPGNSETVKGKLTGTLSNPNPVLADTEDTIDGIVAIVNSDIITRSELNRQVAGIERQMSRKGVPLPERNELRKQVLERLIMDKAQLQQAKDQNIRIDDGQLDATIERIAASNNVSVEEFVSKLRSEGISAERFRDEVRTELIVTRLKEREVDNRVNVSEAEIDAFLASRANKGEKGNRPEVNWVQFLIKLPQSATGRALSDAQTRAEQIQSALKKGLSVEDIQKSNPDLVIDGTGQMGWKGFEEVPTLFSEYLSNGALDSTNIIRSPNGLHVLKILGRRQNTVAGLDTTPIPQTLARHILIRVSPEVSANEARRRLGFVREQLRAGVDFATLAKQYSQDGSASKGGDLGWVYPGDTVPEFERVMQELQPGQYSEVFESRFGFHIIQVQERRMQAASVDRQRYAARQMVRSRKIQESYQEWLKQLRDRTFVEVRL